MGLLTSLHRDDWAAAHAILSQAAANQQPLNMINEAQFVVCLDADPDLVPDEAEHSHVLRHMLTGGTGFLIVKKKIRVLPGFKVVKQLTRCVDLSEFQGPPYLSLKCFLLFPPAIFLLFFFLLPQAVSNRWFDKLQLIVNSNGLGGMLMEHTPLDAPAAVE